MGLLHFVFMGIRELVCGSTNKRCKEAIELLDRQ